ncbi:MAG: prolyl oligopeptidase family serine peptidase [Proteobacteria bacterium]|nr:prolyl oligopeptidase family serine peptidase [Pseudomonadota bacterium]
MKLLKALGLTLAFFFCSSHSMAAETGFLDREIEHAGDTYHYQVYLPRNYSASGQWPVILFLHGAGERGNDGLKQTQVGLGRAIRLNPERWPAITVFPQVPADGRWQGDVAAMAMAALDATIEEFSTDASRVYLTGLSLGGNGSWYLGYHHADRFAAVLAVCGFVQLDGRVEAFVSGTSDPYGSVANSLRNTPVWVVHGDADVVVPVDESRKMVSALQSVGAQVHYTELPGVNHNSWDAAYGDLDIVSWLFEQRSD